MGKRPREGYGEGEAPDRAGGAAGARGALPLRPVEFLVLAVLLDQPAHGYGLVRGIEERTAGAVSPRPGDLYRVLFRMEERGWLERCEPRPAPDLDDQRRTYYRVTAAGRRVASAEARVMAAVSADVMRRLAGSEEAP
jgi:DNA-binding PadR family transcriptional regulator